MPKFKVTVTAEVLVAEDRTHPEAVAEQLVYEAMQHIMGDPCDWKGRFAIVSALTTRPAEKMSCEI